MLGIAVGGREDDYEQAGVDFDSRGHGFEATLERLKRIWADSSGDYTIGPDVSDNPPPLVIGGSIDATYRRAAELGDGWIMGGGTPAMFAEGRGKLEAAWETAGRDGEPHRMSLAYFSLGDEGEANANSYLKHYYSFLGEYADQIAASAATDPDTVRAYVEAFEQAGCEELIIFPSSSDPEQVDLLAEAAL